VDDGSDDPELTQLLTDYVALDPRIRVETMTERGGISAASNQALVIATGDYVALLDHDDVLAEDALFHVTEALQRDPRPDLLYSDEDHMDERGRRFAPFFKPDWSPDLILSENYVCHLMCFERQLALDVGGFRSEFDLSQDHDLLLRLSRRARSIVHIPRVLYHWRTDIDSMARASTLDDRGFRSSRGVIEAHLAESGVNASVIDGLHPGRWRVRYPIPAGTRVSIIIPTAGKTEVLERNLNGLWKTAGETPFEVLIIDNCKGVNNTTIEQYVEKLRRDGRPVRRFDQRNLPFNYPALNNGAASTCESELLLFLNDDTEGIADGWLDAMAEHAVRPEVGAVGAKLLYPDGTIQHAGVTMGLAEICGHSFKSLLGDQRHYYDFPDLIRNVSAVTAACVMVRADVFREISGFDEKAFPIAYNDIDLCLRIGKAGYRIIYTPHALLYHHEAYSKSEKEMNPHPMETMALKTRWREVIARDPFYNPNLTRDKENWSLRWD
jgi:GT2 family glycosyltransferase